MKRSDVDTFEKLSGQIIGVYEEISVLSKKSPNDALNKFKLKFVNDLLSQSNSFLGTSYMPFDDFDVFDPDDMPQNSDVVFILSQYIQCFEKMRADNVKKRNGNWFWMLEAEEGDAPESDGYLYIRTTKPKGLRD